MAVRDEKLERARRVARRKMDFLRHVIIYLVVMAVLAITNNVTWSGYQWWLWPALGWGIGVVAHFLGAAAPGLGRCLGERGGYRAAPGGLRAGGFPRPGGLFKIELRERRHPAGAGQIAVDPPRGDQYC